MVDKRIIEEWLKKADEDFGFASSVVADSVYYAQICFHNHQAGEKYLKAFIVAHELDFKKIHDLIVLLNTCRPEDPALSEIEEECNFLNRFYIDTRYPVCWPANYTKDDALKAKDSAEKICKIIKKSLRDGNYI